MDATRIFAVLAIAWLAAAGFKDHVAALNETSHRELDAIENEVSLASEERDSHPHQSVPGKPTKLDANVNEIVRTDHVSRGAVAENSTTSSPQDRREEDAAGNATLSTGSGWQDGREKGEKGKKERRRGGGEREHVVKIRLRQELVAGRKARNFLNGESA